MTRDVAAAAAMAQLLVLLLLAAYGPASAIRIVPGGAKEAALASSVPIPGSPVADNDSFASLDDRQRRLQDGGSVHRGRKRTRTSAHSHRRTIHVDIPTNPDSHLVRSLPLLDPSDFSTRHWAGLLPASSDGTKYIFYWLFAPASDAHTEVTDDLYSDDGDKVPLLIWLNGGPACSSMDGLWLENGPLRLVEDKQNKKWNVKPRPDSWHRAPAYTLYVDQPVGTGLSFTTGGKHSYPTNDEEVNIDFYHFLNEFLKLHDDKFLDEPDDNGHTKLNRPFFFSGESHAGHYIPSMMNYIRKQNDALSTSNKPGIVMPLSGAAIGNGWVDPKYQYSAHEAAYGVGLIGDAHRSYLKEREVACQTDIAQKRYTSRTCKGLLNSVTDNSFGLNAGYVVSSYDMRMVELSSNSDREFPPGHKVVESYLGGHATPRKYSASISTKLYIDVLAAIHASKSREAGQVYYECTDPPYYALAHQDGLGVTPDVIELLEDTTQTEPIRLLFFNGVHDLICNHVGNEVWMENLQWTHQQDFIVAPRYGWRASSADMRLSGYYKEYANFAYLKVMDSGHMVPMDVPEVSKEMMQLFLRNQSSKFRMFRQGIDQQMASSSCPVCPKPQCEDNNEVECLTCPECPAFPTEKKDRLSIDRHANETQDLVRNIPSARPGLEFGSIVVSQGVVLAILVISLLTTCLVLVCRRPSPRKVHSQQHTFELPEYRDEIADEYGGESDNE